MRILLTGASGLVGSHALKYLLTNTDADVVCLVSMKHFGMSSRIRQVFKDYTDHKDAGNWFAIDREVQFINHDLTTPFDSVTLNQIGHIDAIWNIASESHVDRSIEQPVPFIQNNVNLMLNMLELSRQLNPKIFLQMSTDEVYGPAPEHYAHKEWDTILPSNPYSASKASQEAIAFSYWRTYNVPVVITNTMNIIGEMQSTEKFVPKVMKHVLSGVPMTIHASPDGIIGSRFYLDAYNLADAWWYITQTAFNDIVFPAFYGTEGWGSSKPDKFHIVGERELHNLDFAQMIASEMNKPLNYELVDFHSSRPGHDLRYALDGTALAAEGWVAPNKLDESVSRIVKWTMNHPEWLV